ncbi:uncharacterized protein BDW47DRAFT_85363 [Aspergillus candidus]|uniref:Tetraspanin Tsp3 n=1 Tax=Aspergillus candidus TaxID=41067 RepID=A0A2I2EZX7_ASPCN|nr:hypothetical protein BDW47DRAFT_85363 [Aspergillus candidus]PLB33924.1 hypothetical protein BDW47DRAFT_85363 [Aspergillus candidus]
MPSIFETSVFPIILCLILSLILGAISWSRTLSSFLPTPQWLPGATTLLSALTLLAVSLLGFKPEGTRTNPYRQKLATLLEQLYTILVTILFTATLTILFPDSLLICRLESYWQSHFQAKDAHTIRSIQDRFQCCGLHSTRDRAWPFKNRDHGDDACEAQFGYGRSCLVPWREQTVSTSWTMFAAVALILVVKVGITCFGFRRRANASWMRDVFSERANGDYQRPARAEILNGEEEAEENHDQEAEPRRVMLPHAESAPANEWNQ